MDNLEIRDIFLEKFSLPILNQEELEIMNNPIMSTTIKAVIKNLPQHQKPRTRWLQRWILSNVQRWTNAYSSKTLSEIAEEGTLPNSSYKATITLIPKPDRQNKTNQKTIPISVVNIDVKILKKILVKIIQQHIKKLIHLDQVGFIPWVQGFSIYANQSFAYIMLTNWR